MMPSLLIVPSDYTIPDWAVITGFGFLLLIALLLHAFRSKIFGELRAVLNVTLTRRLYEINNPEYKRFALAGNLYFFLTAGFFLRYGTYVYGGLEEPLHPVSLALLGAVFFTTTYLLKFLLYRLIGFLARLNNAVREYIFNFFLIHRFWAIWITPLLFILLLVHPAWQNIILSITTGITLFWLVFLVVRLFSVFRRNNVHIVFIIFFFAVVELLPFILIIRTFYNYLFMS